MEVIGQTNGAIQKFAHENLNGDVAQAQAMYDNNIAPAPGGPGLADIINPAVQTGVKAVVTPGVEAEVKKQVEPELVTLL